METINIEKYRPSLHYSPKKNWLNDPNGLIYFKGEYHLFYQHNPHDSKWGPMHWGHAVSKDMIKWEELDIALYPDKLGTIFSGSAVIDWHNSSGFFPEEPGMIAIFTHHFVEPNQTEPVQSQSLAFSYDQGRTWTKYEGNPVLKHSTKVDFRDPKVFWHSKSEKWIMILATGQTITIYSSPNLIDWQLESEFGEGIGSHEGVWECPDLFELNVENSDEKKWVLLVSIGDNPLFDKGSRTQYFIGTFDGSTFTADNSNNEVLWLDFGKDNYAGVSFSDIPREDNRRIYLGWMSNWRYANQVPSQGWRGQMTLPRVLTLRYIEDKLKIVQKPVKELDRYFTKKYEIYDEIIISKVEKTIEIDESSLEIVLNIDNLNAEKFGLVLYYTETQKTTVTIDASKNLLTLDRKDSGEVHFSEIFANSQEVKIHDSKRINLRIIVDASSVEMFVNDGNYALSSLIFSDKVCEKVSIFSLDGDIRIRNYSISSPNL
ncbi:glycoside hydrolase family 32 protein [Metabacillus arenae]|uniref:Glycoside hydrolase family 32 protein n=1 Tax=Metabacillus arenae TaxID=2771434 RepID=A0A926NFU5_9BACI|nr:glycoside hydrolase family 32 protein [Metabacillus arenae]MBD1379738.1 glycoside hydrolase family 32 protein [Metabacillus arenae]